MRFPDCDQVVWASLERRRCICPGQIKPLIFAFSMFLFVLEGHTQAFYDWSAQGSWNGRIYEGYDAYASAQIAYLLGSFGGPDNAALTDSDPGTCGEPPSGLNQVCRFSTSYFVQSSGASPTIVSYMRSYGYVYWLAASTSRGPDVCVNDCVTIRFIPPWAAPLYPPNAVVRVPFRVERRQTGLSMGRLAPGLHD